MQKEEGLAYRPEAPRAIGVFLCLVYGFVTVLVSLAFAVGFGFQPQFVASLPGLMIWGWAAVRADRMGLFVDEKGIDVRNIWRSRHFDWSEVVKFGTRGIFLGTAIPAFVIGVQTKPSQRWFPRMFPIHVTYHKSFAREMLLLRLRDEARSRNIEVDFRLD